METLFKDLCHDGMEENIAVQLCIATAIDNLATKVGHLGYGSINDKGTTEYIGMQLHDLVGKFGDMVDTVDNLIEEAKNEG